MLCIDFFLNAKFSNKSTLKKTKKTSRPFLKFEFRSFRQLSPARRTLTLLQTVHFSCTYFDNSLKSVNILNPKITCRTNLKDREKTMAYLARNFDNARRDRGPGATTINNGTGKSMSGTLTNLMKPAV